MSEPFVWGERGRKWKWHYTLESGTWNIQKNLKFFCLSLFTQVGGKYFDMVERGKFKTKEMWLKWARTITKLLSLIFLLLSGHVFLRCSLLHCQCLCAWHWLKLPSVMILQNVCHVTLLLTKLQFSVSFFPHPIISLDRLS